MGSRRDRWSVSDFDGQLPADESPERHTRSLQPPDLKVVFQPIVALDSGQTFAAEALVRCSWPEYANPLHLFRQAESEHTCGRLGRMIRDLTFETAPRVPIFVNVHPQELSSRWLVRPDDPINFSDADVYLEITESATLEHFDLCLGVLTEVCSRTGARLVIDDFGAGYSNLRRVLELEPAVIKLDRELIRGIDQSQRLQLFLRWVVGLCQDLGAKVVAEGIETLAELLAVRDAGVDYAQGFLLARPGYPLPAVQWPRLTPGASPRSETVARAGSPRARAVAVRDSRARTEEATPLLPPRPPPSPRRPRGVVKEDSEPSSKPPGRLKRAAKRPSRQPSKPPE